MRLTVLDIKTAIFGLDLQLAFEKHAGPLGEPKMAAAETYVVIWAPIFCATTVSACCMDRDRVSQSLRSLLPALREW